MNYCIQCYYNGDTQEKRKYDVQIWKKAVGEKGI